jgi:phosphoribosylformylglycinamidine cyclo-ligase
MGHRLEIFTSEKTAFKLIETAKQFQIEGKIIGRVENADKKELTLSGNFGEINYAF